MRLDRASELADPLLQALYQAGQRAASTAPADEPVPAWVRRLTGDVDPPPSAPTLRVLPAAGLGIADADEPDGLESLDEVAGPQPPQFRGPAHPGRRHSA